MECSRSTAANHRVLAGHSTALVKPEGANFPPRLFLRTVPGQNPMIVALCGTSGQLFLGFLLQRGGSTR